MNTNEPKDVATARPWWIASGQAYAGNGIDRQIGVLKADRDEPRTTPTERDANLALAVFCTNQHDALRRVAEVARYVSNDWDDAYYDLQSALAALDKLKEGK